MIGIVVALNSEAKKFCEQIENKIITKIADKPAFLGNICGKDIILAISGIGKVNAALTTQAIIDKFSPEYIINFGTAGGTNNTAEHKKYYLIDKCCQFDFDLYALDGVPIGYIQDYDGIFFKCSTDKIDFLPIGNIASADRFNDDIKDNATINTMPCNLRDMEGGAIGQVCTANSVKLVMIKGVTDIYGSGTSQSQFVDNLHEVCDGFANIIVKVIESL